MSTLNGMHKAHARRLVLLFCGVITSCARTAWRVVTRRLQACDPILVQARLARCIAKTLPHHLLHHDCDVLHAFVHPTRVQSLRRDHKAASVAETFNRSEARPSPVALSFIEGPHARMLLRLCTFRPVALRSSGRLRCLPQLSTLADQAPPSEPKDGRGKAQRQGDDARAARKAAKKAAKAEKRAKREGTLASGSKDCDLCGQSKDMLIRCVM